MIDDKSSYTKNTSIIPTDVRFRNMTYFCKLSNIVGELTGNHCEVGGLPTHITNMESLDLSDSGYG